MQADFSIPLTRAARCLAALLVALTIAPLLQAKDMPAPADARVAPQERAQLIDTLVGALNEGYVFPEKATRLGKTLQQQQRLGEFDSITDGEQLAATLTAAMQQETADGHLALMYSAQAMPALTPAPAPSQEETAAALAQMRAHNFGVDRIERLPFNIGYLQLGAFADAAAAGDVLAATMTVLANTDALIIDLRENGGGDEQTVALLASYFFDARTHLSDIYWRDGDRTEQIWSSDHVAGVRYGQQKAVYVLTSKDTFSAAEDLSYTLQQLKRATVIGETTAGGAHPGDFVQLDEHFSVFMPNGRSINAITGKNWEGVGVKPDHEVPAAAALAKAQSLILNQLLLTEKDTGRVERLKARLTELAEGASAG